MALNDGVFADALTPRRDAEIDLGATLEIIDFLNAAKVDGVVLFGAAGEAVHFSLPDRLKLYNLASRRSRVPMIAGVTHSTLDGAVELAEAAIRADAAALLLAPPFAYRCRQADICDFFRGFARQVDGAPILLHNLPALTEAMEPATAAALLATGLFEGVADASGDAAWLGEVASACARPFTSVAANDSALLESNNSGHVISAAACAVPELLRRPGGGSPLAPRLREFLSRASCFPFPMAIREALAMRRIKTGPHAVDPGDAAATRLAEFREWFRAWLPEVLNEARGAK